jgi:hypothetical protein
MEAIVAPERFDVPAEVGPAHDLEERGEAVARVVLARDHQVVALLQERDEVEIERPRRGQDARAHVGGAAGGRGRHRQMRELLWRPRPLPPDA